jgi:single-stranded-DNA-specific exonuclease
MSVAAKSARRRDWQIAEVDRADVKRLADTFKISPIVARCMCARGISSDADAERYLNPTLGNVCDPFDLQGMQAAVERIERARAQNEHVIVFGDYDVDGISGTALLVRALRYYGVEKLSYGLPNRQVEGYGLSADRVDWAAGLGASLIVTVDNGIAAIDAANRAKERGVDLVVTDHHLPQDALPHAEAIVNPKLQNEEFSGRELCGAALAFQLGRALTGKAGGVDLAALGTIADIVPLTGDNRDLAAAGLAHIRMKPRAGLAALNRVAKLNASELRAESIAYQLAPRINAGGRMDDGTAGLELLLTDDFDEANRLAEILDGVNEDRRVIERGVLEDVLNELAANFEQERRSIVLAREEWHAGVIGIVASRVQDLYYRPVILIAIDEDGTGKGSGRSIEGFDLAGAIASCGHLLEKHGGHMAAAGLTIQGGNVTAFAEAFEASARDAIPEGDIRKPLRIDAQVPLSGIDPQLIHALDRLQPCGHHNPAPVFATFGAEVLSGSCRELRGGHLKLMVRDDTATLHAIGFGMGDRLNEIANASAVDIAFAPQFNTWRGETSVQLLIKDIAQAAG